jgi:hypothetical protein
MCDLKKMIFKNPVSVWQNRSLAFKIANLPLKFCIFKKISSYLRFEKADFLCFAIWFKIALIAYEIAVSNAP